MLAHKSINKWFRNNIAFCNRKVKTSYFLFLFMYCCPHNFECFHFLCYYISVNNLIKSLYAISCVWLQARLCNIHMSQYSIAVAVDNIGTKLNALLKDAESRVHELSGLEGTACQPTYSSRPSISSIIIGKYTLRKPIVCNCVYQRTKWEETWNSN